MKIPVNGGQAETVCDVWTVSGGSWSNTGVIVFSSNSKGLYRVAAAGGSPMQIPRPEKGAMDYRFPSFLPDGQHFLVTSNTVGGIFVASAETGELRSVLPDESGLAQYAEPGYILFLHGDSLMAQPFDAKTFRVSGVAQRIAESVFNLPHQLFYDDVRTLAVSAFLSDPAHMDQRSGGQQTFYARRSGLCFFIPICLQTESMRSPPSTTDTRQNHSRSCGCTTCAAVLRVRSRSESLTICTRPGLRTVSRLLSLPGALGRKRFTSSRSAEAVRSSCCFRIESSAEVRSMVIRWTLCIVSTTSAPKPVAATSGPSSVLGIVSRSPAVQRSLQTDVWGTFSP